MKEYWKNLSALQKRGLASRVGTSAAYLRQVFLYGRKAGYEMAMKIESETGIPRHEIRPDIYPTEEYKKAS